MQSLLHALWTKVIETCIGWRLALEMFLLDSFDAENPQSLWHVTDI